MLYIDKIDDYTVRLSDKPDGAGNVRLLTIPVESKKEVDDGVWMRKINTETTEGVLNHYPVDNITFNGSTYTSAESLVVDMNAQIGGLKPKSSWDYEGVLTIGFLPDVLYGWVEEIPLGSITPSNPQVAGFEVTAGIIWNFKKEPSELNVSITGGHVNSCNTIEIAGVEFTGFVEGVLFLEENPFPAEGEQCTIKLK